MIGETIGRYRVSARLGAGGMGEVYLAEDTQLDRQVALKFLPQAMWDDAMAKERLIREAKAASKLDHPNIVTIHGIEEVDGRLFIVMAHVSGKTLDKYWQEHGGSNDDLIDVALQIAAGLHCAHEAGVIHRDLKPGNILVDDKGRVRLLDFGIARMQGSTRLTQAGSTVGTLAYSPPELIEGREAQPASDIYSLGVVLYQMLTGRLPFEADHEAALLYSILQDEPGSLTEHNPAVPGNLQSVVMRCLEKRPDQRYPDCETFAADLKACRSGSILESPSRTPVTRTPGRRISKAWMRPIWVAVILLLAMGTYLTLRSTVFAPDADTGEAAATSGAIRSIAVLPLDNFSGDPAQDYFAEGMTDELTTNLATISQLRVISRGSVMQFQKGSRPPSPEIGRLLNVDVLVEGSVTRLGDKVRISAQLIDAHKDAHLWAKSFERNSNDVLALQAELASAIANEINVQLTPSEASRLAAARPVNPEAHDAYLKGRYFFNRPSDENLKKAIAQFEQAITLSPDFAPAYSGLSDAYLWAGYNEGFLTASEARPKAKEAAEKAVLLDDNSAEAHTSLAVFKQWYEYDWVGSEREYRRAIALNPSYAYAHDQFSLCLAFQGRFDEAITEGRRAAELDPLSPQILIDNGVAYSLGGDNRESLRLAKAAGELDPTYFFPVMVEGWVACQQGRFEDAIRALDSAKSMESPAYVSAWLAYAYGASGDSARAMAELEDLKRRSLHGQPTPFNLAMVYLGLRDHARAIEYLEEAYASDSQWLGWLKSDRAFDPLRAEPRFIALLQRLGLES